MNVKKESTKLVNTKLKIKTTRKKGRINNLKLQIVFDAYEY